MPDSDLYNSNRRLATVMVADIVGYSRLMEADMSTQLQDLRKMEQNGEIAAIPGVNFDLN